VLASTAWQLTLGGVLTLAVALAAGEGSDAHPDRISTDSVLALVYLIAIGTLVAYTAYTWLLRNAPVSKVSTYAYVNPVISISLGALLLDEEVTPTMLIGAAIILVAVAIVVRRESVRQPARLVSTAGQSPSPPSRPRPRPPAA
jgi:drug/metabolite transporter (DMT)-like permease